MSIDEKKLLGEDVARRAPIDSSKIDTEKRSVEILISTENPVRRVDYWSGESYDEVLLHGDENVDLSRADTAKLRYMHGGGKYGELPIGRLENVQIENRQLRATAVFSEANPDAEMLWRMVNEGTMTEISVGGIKREVRITERDGDIPLVEVTRWEFTEASLVDIGADKNAGIGRSQNNKNEGAIMTKLEELRRKLDEIKTAEKPNADEIARVQKEIDAEISRLNAENEDLRRQMAIKDLATKHDLPDDELKRFLGDKSKTDADLARYLLERRQEADKNPGVSVARPAGSGREEQLSRAIADALVQRAGVKLERAHEDAKLFASASLGDIMRAVGSYDGYDRDEMIRRALSSDQFPILLGNVANRVLTAAFDEAPGTFDQWTDATELPDFKTRTEVSLSQFSGRLRKLSEYAEPRQSKVTEDGESWRLYSYGEAVRLSRKMIIDDDLGAFTDLVRNYAVMAKRTANGLVYDLLQGKGEFANYVMSDGKPVFCPEHRNLDNGTELSVAALSAARTRMRRQKGASGEALNIQPAHLLVPPELETTALRLVTSEADPSSNNAGVVNPFRGALRPIVDAELDPAPWYLAAARRTIKVGYLAGTGRKPLVAEKERSLGYVEFECVFDFGLVAEDFRGIYKNTSK